MSIIKSNLFQKPLFSVWNKTALIQLLMRYQFKQVFENLLTLEIIKQNNDNKNMLFILSGEATEISSQELTGTLDVDSIQRKKQTYTNVT